MTPRTILIVDDEREVGAMLKDYLEHLERGYRGVVATSGEQALQLLRAQPPDLVLLDILMDGMGGIETLKRIKQMAPSVPVAMVTAVYDQAEARRAFEAGAYEYITKPIDLEYLQTAVLIKLGA